MYIRKANIHDLSEILSLYDGARDFMVRTGNPNQWAARGWPPDELIRQDIEQGKSYVCVGEDGTPEAVFYYEFGDRIDHNYGWIDGAWRSDKPYGVVHRIAAKGGKGAGRFCIQWAYDQCGYLRMDTHEDNRIMQKCLKDLGFAYCGVIRIIEDTVPRLAYDKL
jgi:ribosomal protein S18 acetylase RimI-like enzyme